MINGNNFNTPPPKIKVLVTPLDWGLGHATRCIPIINQLIFRGCEVIIVASGNGYFLLKKEFPSLIILRLKGHKIRYSRRKGLLPLALIFQSTSILFSIIRERLWLKKFLEDHDIAVVISDNRFGMFATKVTSVYITHQLSVKTGNRFTENLAQKIHLYFIRKYSTCWVPDFKETGLAGELSHPSIPPQNVLYIGGLSRFRKLENITKKYNVLITISGPEPQRSIFEDMLISQIKSDPKRILFVRGLPGDTSRIESGGNITFINHLSGDDLNTSIEESEIVVTRSGYTSVMDLVKLGKRAILVPTPGQSEQEYLASHLMANKLFYCIPQDQFSFHQALAAASTFQWNQRVFEMDEYKGFVDDLVADVHAKILHRHTSSQSTA